MTRTARGSGAPPGDPFVAALERREAAAWKEFLDRHAGMIDAIGASLHLASEEREDLLQKVCLSALRSIHKLRDPSRLSSWVYTIARRHAVDAVRRRREIPVEEVPDGAAGLADLRDPSTADEELEAIEHAAALLDAVARLPAPCRDLIEALYLRERTASYAELAEEHGIPLGSIGPMRGRCLEKLRGLIEAHQRGPFERLPRRSPVATRNSREPRHGR